MDIGKLIRKLREDAKLTQAQFSELFCVSQQAVQKWESGATAPDVEKIIKIAKYFDVSLDALLMENDNRVVEEMRSPRGLMPQYQNMHDWEFYSSNLLTEYQQSVEEGLDLEAYRDVFSSVARLPKDEIKKRLGDVLFDVVISAKQREGYPYVEPSDLEQIQLLRRGTEERIPYDREALTDKIHGAWLGRVCGCMLGKTLEGIRTNELIPFLRESGNYPLHRYVLKSDLREDTFTKYKYHFSARDYADAIDGMPADDDMNYTVMAQGILDEYGREFTPYDVAKTWSACQGKNAYCTAERVTFCNFINGYQPPVTAIYKNPYREWIGGQIRGDYYGYINPGNPKLAAEMAWRDASISHVKNGIYGGMMIAAMLSVAATTSDPEAILLGGLAEIPHTSRLHEAVMAVLNAYKSGMKQRDCFAMIHEKYDEHSLHGWCHTIPNAMIVVAALLYGEGNYGRSICMAVEAGFDTDCNGATVGSILGMANGKTSIPAAWSDPIRDTLYTTIFGVGTVKISDCAKRTLAHIL